MKIGDTVHVQTSCYIGRATIVQLYLAHVELILEDDPFRPRVVVFSNDVKENGETNGA